MESALYTGLSTGAVGVNIVHDRRTTVTSVVVAHVSYNNVTCSSLTPHNNYD